MLLEAENSWAEAEKVYARLLEDNPLDQVLPQISISESPLVLFRVLNGKHLVISPDVKFLLA